VLTLWFYVSAAVTGSKKPVPCLSGFGLLCPSTMKNSGSDL